MKSDVSSDQINARLLIRFSEDGWLDVWIGRYGQVAMDMLWTGC